MSIFLRRFIEHKKYIFVAISVVFVCGFLFGIYKYQYSSELIKNNFQKLFYFNDEKFTSHYQMYLIQSGLYILICTYLSSSYLGHIGLLFLMFLKGLQLSFSLLYVVETLQISLLIIMIMFIEAGLEIILCMCMNIMFIYISLYVSEVTFFIEQNFNIKSMLNYKLNCIIISLVIFFLSLAFRIYIIPMF